MTHSKRVEMETDTLIFSPVKDIEVFFEEFRYMACLHNEEVNLFGLQLGYSEKYYKELFDANSYCLFQVRYDDKLVGYSGFFIYSPPQHLQALHAKQDILYLTPEIRGQGIGTKFIEYSDVCFKEMGCTHVLQCVPNKSDWGLLLERIGYHKLESIYLRSL